MRLGGADVSRVAELARLDLDAGAAARLADELTRILVCVEPLAPGADVANAAGAVPRREDVAHAGPADAVLAESAGRRGRHVAVPTVIG